MTFDPTSVEVLCVTLPRIIVSKSHENTSKYVDTVTLFAKNLKQRSLTPRWPLTPHLLRSHVWLYPRIIVSKSHGNTSMYVDTVINFAKNYHIHTHTYTPLHIHTTYYVQNQWSHSLFLNKGEIKMHLIGSTYGIFLILNQFMGGSNVAEMQHSFRARATHRT